MTGIIHYGAGNQRSVANALERLGFPYVISHDVRELERSDRIILPGVGEARSAMAALERLGLAEWLRSTTKPYLGICLGMQLLFERSEERNTPGLGILEGTVRRFDSGDSGSIKVPHMGWNRVEAVPGHPLFAGIPSESWFYFVHSYYGPCGPHTIGRTIHDVEFASAVQLRNFTGVQFHAEKSGQDGLTLLRNFITTC